MYFYCMSLKDAIRRLRKNAGLSQGELAEKIGTTQKVISDYERGRTSPSNELLPLMAKLFGVTVDDLLDAKNLPDNDKRTIHGKKRTAKIVDLYDQLTPEEQRVVLRQIQGLIAERKRQPQED
jgi:transcriptional regulator with XRE-family HTH domain